MKFIKFSASEFVNAVKPAILFTTNNKYKQNEISSYITIQKREREETSDTYCVCATDAHKLWIAPISPTEKSEGLINNISIQNYHFTEFLQALPKKFCKGDCVEILIDEEGEYDINYNIVGTFKFSGQCILEKGFVSKRNSSVEKFDYLRITDTSNKEIYTGLGPLELKIDDISTIIKAFKANNTVKTDCIESVESFTMTRFGKDYGDLIIAWNPNDNRDLDERPSIAFMAIRRI